MGLFNLAKTMVSVLPKVLEYTVVKPWTKKKSDLPVVNKPSRISPHGVFIVDHLLVKNN